MIWSGTKQQNWGFLPEPLEESCWNPPNPARGWYAVYTFPAEQKIDPKELKWSLRDGETVALVLLDIGAFRDRLLDKETLDNIREILFFFKKYKRDVIFRPVYDREGKGLLHEPDMFETVLKHLRQIGELLTDTDHSVFVWQGLLVGSWGEMHTSKFLSEDCLLRMRNCIQPYLGEEIYLAVRTPAQWRILVQECEYQKGNFGQIGIFDDGIFGSMTHLGTFGTMTKEAAGWKQPWMRKDEMVFIGQLTEEMPCGGEVTVCADEENMKLYTTDFIVSELKTLHLTYLNSAYNMKILDYWKKTTWNACGVWKGSSLYEYIGNHLGYRLIVKKIKMSIQRRENIEFTVEIENVGFGRVFQETELFLIIKDKDGIKKIPILMDIRKIYPRNRCQGSVMVKAVEGKIFLALCRKADGREIYFANKNSVASLYLGCLYKRKDK